MMLEKKAKVTLGLIAGDFGADQLLVSLVRKGIQEGYFEIAIHGWLHENLTALGYMRQVELIRNAKNKLQSLFPEARISTLLPPYHAVDANVLMAAAANGLKYVGGNLLHGEPFNLHGIKYRPITVDTAKIEDDKWIQYDLNTIVNQAERSLRVYGYAMAIIHPQQFLKFKDVIPLDGVDENRLSQIEALIDWARMNARVIRLDELDELDGLSEPSTPRGMELIDLLILYGLPGSVLVITGLAVLFMVRRRGKPESKTKQ